MARKATLSQSDWKSIDAILLDMDGTLLDLSFDNRFWKIEVPSVYAKNKGMTLEESLEFLGRCYKDYSGTLNWYCTDFWAEKLGFDIIEHKTKLAHKVSVRPGTIEFLEKTHASSKDVYLVTNAHPETLRVKLEQTRIEQYFDKLYTSHQFHQPKESPSFWAQLEEDMAIPLSKCLFIDDTESILMQAQHSGVKHIAIIEQPDSSLPPKTYTELPSINYLDELLDNFE